MAQYYKNNIKCRYLKFNPNNIKVMAKMTIKDWVKAYKNGDFVSRDYETQVKAGWYDWFCKTASLARKTEAMAKILSRITKPELLECRAVSPTSVPPPTIRCTI